VGGSQNPHEPHYSETGVGCQSAYRFAGTARLGCAIICAMAASFIHAKSVSAGVNELTRGFAGLCHYQTHI
jgi:hypothetical protein